jgi:hypothetical protein
VQAFNLKSKGVALEFSVYFGILDPKYDWISTDASKPYQIMCLTLKTPLTYTP